MKYPRLSELETYREMIDVFKGYNHNLLIGEGEFYDMTNLTSSNYPILSPRPKRGTFATASTGAGFLGMISKDAFCYVEGTKLYINGKLVEALTLDTQPKTLISMGAYIIIMPDKKYINTENWNDFGSIEAEVTTSASVTFELCTVEGAVYGEDKTKKQATPPVITEAMEEGTEEIPLWLDTSSSPHSLKQYSLASAQWSSIATTYIKISSNTENIGLPFSVGDGVTITGVEGIPDLASPTNAVIWAKDERVGDNKEKISKWIVVKGIIDELKTQLANKPITIERRMPETDFIIESGNRLWGCKYGFINDGAVVNELYASKLGDFKNWNCFAGISTDSYAASLGTDGQFTGAITHLGYPIFFKENYMHKVYGNYPANFQIQTTACRGVQKDCHKSLAIVGETLFYKARSGVCAYDGSLPVEISAVLGDKVYTEAVSGVRGNKYYISMKEDGADYNLFVYDTRRGTWHREDNLQPTEFCAHEGELYYICDDTDGVNKIKTIQALSDDDADKENVVWEAITGYIGTDSPDKKYISRLVVRLSLEVGTRVYVYAEYDSLGTYEFVYSMTGSKMTSFSIPIRTKRCDHLRLKIVGDGPAKIFSITKTIEQGSDL